MSRGGRGKRATWGVQALLALLLLASSLPMPNAGALVYHDANGWSSLSTTLTMRVPAGTYQHDLLIAQIAYIPVEGANMTAPEGWTLQGETAAGAALVQRVYTRTAPTPGPWFETFTYSQATLWAGGLLVYTGADSANPVNAWAGQASPVGTTITAPEVTTTVPNTMVIVLFSSAHGRAALQKPQGMTVRIDDVGTGADPGVSILAADKVFANVGSTGVTTTTNKEDVGIGQTLAIRGPGLGFSATATTAQEGGGAVSLPITMTSPSGSPVTVQYSTSGTAASGSDYTTSSSVTVPAGSTSANLVVSILDDGAVEASETIVVTLTSSDHAVLGTTTHTITIVDNDTNFAFDSAGYLTYEGAGTVALTVVRTGILGKTSTVQYSTSPDAATAGSDYTTTSGTLTFAPDETQKTFTVPILQDKASETDETFFATLSSASGATFATPRTATVTIIDDETPYRVGAYPFLADGTEQVGARWGEWMADPGTSPVVSGNFLKLTNISVKPKQQFSIDFVPSSFTGTTRTGESIPINGNIQFAWWEDTTPDTSTPGEGTYVFDAVSNTGSVTGQFSNTDTIVYVTYRLVNLQAPTWDQDYEAGYVAT